MDKPRASLRHVPHKPLTGLRQAVGKPSSTSSPVPRRTGHIQASSKSSTSLGRVSSRPATSLRRLADSSRARRR
eukprot:14546453-Alexandrium_andersonii.AAC.1